MSSNNEKTAATQSADIRQTLGINNASSSRRPILKWLAIVAVVLLAIFVVWKTLSNDSSQTVQYKTAEISRGKLSVTVTATGTLQPVNQVEVGSEISGTIKEVLVDFNHRVKQGQILATMNTDQLQARVNQAKASLQLAKAKVKQTEATVIETKSKLRRARELAKTGMCAEQDCDAAQASYDRAVADLASANAQVAQAQASLDAELATLAKATILSPINGIVLKRDVEPGQTVASSFQTPVMFTLAENLTQMELHVDVDEADVGQISEQQQAEFSVDAYPNKRFPATITEVHFASQTVDGVVTYKTVLRVDNSDLLLRPGMTATADILVNQVADALLVPNTALRFSPPVQNIEVTANKGGLVGSLIPRPPRDTKQQEEVISSNAKQKVWALRDGQAVVIPLTTGATNGIMSEVISGDLQPGMALIIDTISNKP